MAAITEETKLKVMIKKYPATAEVLKKKKIDCFGCLGIEQETVRNAAWYHGYDLARLIDELNKAASGK